MLRGNRLVRLPSDIQQDYLEPNAYRIAGEGDEGKDTHESQPIIPLDRVDGYRIARM
jgi:hypothetical protein